jgi:hypothetical protein
MAGNLVDALEPQSGVLACLESAVGSDTLEDTSPFFPLDENPAAIPLFYNCVVDGVEAGELTLPDNEHRLNNVAALMHLVRMTHSGLAFIVSVSPPSSP